MNKCNRNRRRELGYFLLFIGMSLAGVSVFVLIPFADVVRRSFMTVMSGEFAGLDNYRTVIGNQAFRLAVGNTLHFVGVAIPLLVVISLAAALVLSRIRDIRVIKSLYLFPMALPTATVVIVWRMFFYRQDFDSLVVSYLWKNTGYTIVLWLAGDPERACRGGEGGRRKWIAVSSLREASLSEGQCLHDRDLIVSEFHEDLQGGVSCRRFLSGKGHLSAAAHVQQLVCQSGI